MQLGILLLTAFVGVLFVYAVGRFSARTRSALAVLVALAPTVWLALLYGQTPQLDYYRLPFLNVTLTLRLEPLAWFFAMAIAAIGLLSIIFSLEYMKGKERLDFYYSSMLLVNASMLGIVLSGDLISLYIFWEIMSWSTYLVISYKGGKAVAAGLKYMIMSVVGSCAMLLAIVSLYVHYQTVEIPALASAIQGASVGYALFVLVMFVIAFGIKNAIMPLHTWLPDAHSEAVSTFSAVLSGVLVRMGVYGVLLIMYGVLRVEMLQKLGSGALNFSNILCWIGAITIVIPTFTALLQDDSKRLIAWHTVGQGGYMILGIAFGSALGIAGGIFHTLAYGLSVALLFFVAGAVEHRTRGERDLNRLGGLAKRMPLTFFAALCGICGFIGVPLTGSFVSKWLIYKTLIAHRYPFLAFAALIGTWGTILSVYKFLHNIFLGQLPEKYKNVKEVPFSMRLPMILLAFAILLFGILPGIPLKAIAAIQSSLGLEPLKAGLFAMPAAVGELNMINILAAVAGSCLVAYVLFRVCRRSRRVPQSDSYAAGSYVPVDRYQYSARFYERVYQVIGPYVRDRVDAFYYWLVEKSEGFFDGVRKLYTGSVNTYALYIILFLALMVVAKLAWGR